MPTAPMAHMATGRSLTSVAAAARADPGQDSTRGPASASRGSRLRGARVWSRCSASASSPLVMVSPPCRGSVRHGPRSRRTGRWARQPPLRGAACRIPGRQPASGRAVAPVDAKSVVKEMPAGRSLFAGFARIGFVGSPSSLSAVRPLSLSSWLQGSLALRSVQPRRKRGPAASRRGAAGLHPRAPGRPGDMVRTRRRTRWPIVPPMSGHLALIRGPPPG